MSHLNRNEIENTWKKWSLHLKILTEQKMLNDQLEKKMEFHFQLRSQSDNFIIINRCCFHCTDWDNFIFAAYYLENLRLLSFKRSITEHCKVDCQNETNYEEKKHRERVHVFTFPSGQINFTIR